MKKTVYVVCGTALVIVAAVIRTVAGGGIDLALLVGLGLALIVASADVPTKAGVRR